MNDFITKRLRSLAAKAGVAVPESDEALIEALGSILGAIERAIFPR